MTSIAGHSGELAVAVARAHGVETMFTLSGAHVFPMYDGAVKAEPPMRLLDVRHEQTAAFAAEATGKLTRVPGLAVLTAGPGVTNGVSAIAQAQFAGSPMVVVGGRAPASRWGSGALQEIDHLPIVDSGHQAGAHPPHRRRGRDRHGRRLHRGALVAPRAGRSSTSRWTSSSTPRTGPPSAGDAGRPARARRRRRRGRSPTALAGATRPLLILGTDVWADRAEEAALRFVEALGIPTITNGMGRGIVPGGHPLLVTKARGAAINGADLVVVVGTPLDFRLGYGVFGGKDGATPARVVHVADSPGQLSAHAELAASAGRRPLVGPRRARSAPCSAAARAATGRWVAELADVVRATAARDSELLTAEADPIHPARIYGELVPRLADDAVVIGDGGDFVCFAGKFVEPKRPGGWLDPGPYGCLGAGLGAAIAARLARPSARSCCCSATAPPASR